MARQFTRSRGRLGEARKTLWLFIDTVQSTLSGAPTAVLTNQLSAAALALRPFTVIRTRGIMHVISDQAVSTELYGADLGFAVVSEQASAIGVTAVPTPLTDKGSDLFFVYEQAFSRFEFKTGVGIEGATGVLHRFDSKAMRKVDGDQDVVVTVENEISGSIIVTSGCMLIKLH